MKLHILDNEGNWIPLEEVTSINIQEGINDAIIKAWQKQLDEAVWQHPEDTPSTPMDNVIDGVFYDVEPSMLGDGNDNNG